MEDVNITMRGCFYIVTNDEGKELLRKKIGSNGTIVTNYEEEAKKAAEEAKRAEEQATRKAMWRRNSSEAAYSLYEELSKNGECSHSGNFYRSGRKPTSDQYDNRREFFEVGEQRVHSDYANSRFVLQT